MGDPTIPEGYHMSEIMSAEMQRHAELMAALRMIVEKMDELATILDALQRGK